VNERHSRRGEFASDILTFTTRNERRARGPGRLHSAHAQFDTYKVATRERMLSQGVYCLASWRYSPRKKGKKQERHRSNIPETD